MLLHYIDFVYVLFEVSCGVCVCVNHLKRCKTSNLLEFWYSAPVLAFDFILLNFRFAGGAGGTDETGTNKDTHQLPVISMGVLIDVPARFVNFVMGSG